MIGPLVEEIRRIHDPPARAMKPKPEVVILRPTELPVPPDLVDRGCPHHGGRMRDRALDPDLPRAGGRIDATRHPLEIARHAIREDARSQRAATDHAESRIAAERID